MSFFCAISGEPPQHPVISPKSGLVYERRLIVAHLNQHGTEPSTGEALNEDELIAVKTNPNSAPPRPPTLTSIPAILHTLQSEWDALVLETNTLRSQYIATRQELAHALYQSDAATRVVARLARERDEAREALANVRAATGMGSSGVTVTTSNGTHEADVDMEAGPVEPAPLPDEIQEVIDTQFKALSSTRKKRKMPAVPSPARLSEAPSETFPSPAGTKVRSFSLAPRLSASAFLTGADDGVVRLWDAGSVVASLSGHKGAVTALEWSASSDDDSYIISGSEDSTVRLWSSASPYDHKATLTAHTGAITGLSVHPSRQLLLSASQDGTFAMHALATAQLISRTMPLDASSSGGFSTSALHPDGVLLGLGLASAPQVQVYDIRSRALAASLDFPSGAGITALSFSENGYSLAAVSSNSSSLAIFDLRKLTVQRTVDAGFPLSGVSYDHVGAYFAAVGPSGVAAWAAKASNKAWQGEWTGEAGVLKWGTGAGAGKIWVAGSEGVSVWAPEE